MELLKWALNEYSYIFLNSEIFLLIWKEYPKSGVCLNYIMEKYTVSQNLAPQPILRLISIFKSVLRHAGNDNRAHSSFRIVYLWPPEDDGFQVSTCDLGTAFRLQLCAEIDRRLRGSEAEPFPFPQVSWHRGRPADLMPGHLLSVDFWEA